MRADFISFIAFSNCLFPQQFSCWWLCSYICIAKCDDRIDQSAKSMFVSFCFCNCKNTHSISRLFGRILYHTLQTSNSRKKHLPTTRRSASLVNCVVACSDAVHVPQYLLSLLDLQINTHKSNTL